MRHPVHLLTALVFLCTLTGCAQKANVEAGGPPSVKKITIGTERDASGRIVRPNDTFSVTSRVLYFNAELENITEEIPVTAYWVRGDQGGNFTKYSVTAEPGLTVAKFELEKPTDWPADTYTIFVEVGPSTDVPGASATYTLK